MHTTANKTMPTVDHKGGLAPIVRSGDKCNKYDISVLIRIGCRAANYRPVPWVVSLILPQGHNFDL